MAGNKYIVDWDTITRFVTEAFEKYGIPEEDAKICTDVLLESDRRGIESHGVNRFKPIYLDRIKVRRAEGRAPNFEIVKETETTAVVDGHDGMGQVIGYKSMQMAIEKAKEVRHGHGRGPQFLPLRHRRLLHLHGHQGRLHRHDRHQRPSLRRATPGAPRACSAPTPSPWAYPRTKPFDFNFDCATSITQNGKIRILRAHRRRGASGHRHRRGRRTRDRRRRRGAQAHPPEHRGAGPPWAASARRWADTRATASPCSWSSCPPCCRTAISESSSTAWTRTATSALPAWATSSLPSTPTTSWARSSAARRPETSSAGVRASRRMPGADRIYTAGEKEYEIRLARKDGVPINESVQHEISQIRDELGLTEYVFPWEK